MAIVTASGASKAVGRRSRGLAVVASAQDVPAACTNLPTGETDWTVMALFGHLQVPPEQIRLIHCGMADKGWGSRYRELRPPLRQWLAHAEAEAGPFDVLATHGPTDLDAHPAIWHIANLLTNTAGLRPLMELALRDEARSVGVADVARRAELLKVPINGQIVQYPQGASPGVMVSPFWTIPWHQRNLARQAMLWLTQTESWYVIMADTTFGNLPPSYVLPFIGGRFCVDPNERRFLAERHPDLDLIEFCQSQLTPEQTYRQIPDVAKEYDLVYSARICGVKRHMLLLDALAELQRAGHRLRTLLMFYPKDNEDTIETTRLVRERIAQTGLDVSLHTTGGRGNNEAEMALMLNRCKIGVFMSAEEGPAFAIPEYLLCDLPVVAWSGLRGGGLHFLNATNSRLFDSENDLPEVLLDALAARTSLHPRRSALDQAIGEDAGNACFAARLAEHGIQLSDDARPLRRHLDSVRLKELCR